MLQRYFNPAFEGQALVKPDNIHTFSSMKREMVAMDQETMHLILEKLK